MSVDEIATYRESVKDDRFYMKDNVQVALRFGKKEDGSTSTVSICELGSGSTSAD